VVSSAVRTCYGAGFAELRHWGPAQGLGAAPARQGASLLPFWKELYVLPIYQRGGEQKRSWRTLDGLSLSVDGKQAMPRLFTAPSCGVSTMLDVYNNKNDYSGRRKCAAAQSNPEKTPPPRSLGRPPLSAPGSPHLTSSPLHEASCQAANARIGPLAA
jgi:hypothetical protein